MSGLEFVSSVDLIADGEQELPWLIENVFPKGATVLLVAQAKTGKTSFLIEASVALLTDGTLLDNPANASALGNRRIGYVQNDMAPALFRQSVKHARYPGGHERLAITYERFDIGAPGIARQLTEACLANHVSRVNRGRFGRACTGATRTTTANVARLRQVGATGTGREPGWPRNRAPRRLEQRRQV